MERKKYIRRRIVKQQSLNNEIPVDFLEKFEEFLAADEKRYKYVRFGITTDLKAQYDKHKHRDDICWSSMKVYYQTADPYKAESFNKREKTKENYINNEIKFFPESVFDERPAFYVYTMMGRRKKGNMVKRREGQNTKENIDWDGVSWTERAFKYPNRKIRIGTSFSGIGAIEYALKRLGLNTEILFAGDIDKNCKTTYFANHDIREDQWHSDIHEFDAKPHKGKVDLFVGGAPCQAFSIVGNQRGFEDTRGTLFREFARVVKECEPKVFIFENVQGLFKHDNGNTWEVMRSTFENYCGYDVHFQLLNARDYGIPQTRERLYCIGFKNETEFKYPAPIALNYTMYDFMEDFTATEYFCETRNSKILANPETHQQALADGNDSEKFNDFIFPVKDIEEKYYLSEKVAKYVLAGGTKTFKTSTETDLRVARPLLHSMHKMHRAGVDNYVTYMKDKGVNGIRKLTPRECHRLMGFRDDFQIVVSNTSAYMQAGNSIVVDVLMALLKQMDITLYGVNNGK